MEQAPTNCQISANNRWFQKPAKDSLVQAGIPPTLIIPWRALFRCRPMSAPELSLLGFKRIRGFVSILRSINPTIIIIIVKLHDSSGVRKKSICVECSLSPFSDGFSATFFSNSTHLELISPTGGKHIGNTDCLFLLSFDPKIFEDFVSNTAN